MINTWPGWKCVRPLGEGGFGRVYEIEREDGGKTYRSALKVITIPEKQEEVQNFYSEGMMKENVTAYYKSVVDDFRNEFALMYDLKGYTNIVSYEEHMVVEHKDEIGWDILIRMELLTPLQEWLRVNPLTENVVIKLGCDICTALELCHKNNIIHRDIKPENIFVNKTGDFKLGDFGIARVAETATTFMSKKGTYPYMAPEVFKCQKYNEKVDTYSLGIVLYRLLNNQRTPFLPMGQLVREHYDIALDRRMSGELIPNPINGCQELKKVILKAIQYDSRKRYHSALEFRKALEQCNGKGMGDNPFPPYKGSFDEPISHTDTLGGPTDGPKPPVPPTPQPEPTGKKWLILSLCVVGLLLVVVVLLISKLEKPEVQSESESVKSIENSNEIEAVVENAPESFEVSKSEDTVVETEKEIIGDLKIGCNTHAILIGDTVEMRVAADNFYFDNSTEGLEFFSDNTDIATVDTNGIVTGISWGVVNITASYQGKETSYQLYVAKYPGFSDAFISAEYDRINTKMYETTTVDLMLEGNIPEKFNIICYCSGGMSVSYEWGEYQENVLPVNITPVSSKTAEGKITVLLYPQGEPGAIVAATSIDVTISE